MVDDELAYLDALEAARLMHTGKLSPVELTQAMLRRIERLDPRLLAYATVTAELAMAQAAEAERRISKRQILSPLHGVPMALKDLCFTAGVPTEFGQPLRKGFRPAYDGTVARRLRDAGMVLLGKLQLTEAAFADHHPDVTPPRNPWNDRHWPGASSSGSGVAVAAGLCHAAVGTDTGGSIRFPSAANGVTGLKPTWGRVSVHGAFELAASLDHIGPMARTAADCGAMLGLMAGADPQDPTALPDPVPDYLAGDERSLGGLRIAMDPAYIEGIDEPTRRALLGVRDVLASLGAEFVSLTFPDTLDAVRDWPLACGAETAVAHAELYPARKSAYGPGLSGLIDAGRAAGAMDLQQVWLRRRAFTGRVKAFFQQADLLLIPAQPMASPTWDAMQTLGSDPEGFERLVRYTAPFDMSGSPTLTFPAGWTAGHMPVAAQLVAPHLGEAQLVRAGRAFQRLTDWHQGRPA